MKCDIGLFLSSSRIFLAIIIFIYFDLINLPEVMKSIYIQVIAKVLKILVGRYQVMENFIILKETIVRFKYVFGSKRSLTNHPR